MLIMSAIKLKIEDPRSAAGYEAAEDVDFPKILEEIDECQNQINLLNEKASDEILEIEKKYNKLRKPYFQKRNEVISRIPNFWTTTFVNNQEMAEILEQDEADALRFLKKLEVEESEDIRSGYKVTFYFGENPYFENEVLTKEFHLGSAGTHTPIRWKSGVRKREPIFDADEPSLRHKSFFEWFTSYGDPISDDIGELIKDDLWLNPLKYYLGLDVDVENAPDGNREEECESEDEDEENFDTRVEEMNPIVMKKEKQNVASEDQVDDENEIEPN